MVIFAIDYAARKNDTRYAKAWITRVLCIGQMMKGELNYRRTNPRRSGEPRGRVSRKEESGAGHLWGVELPGLSIQTMPVSTLGGWWRGSAGVCLAGRRPWLPSLTPHKLGILMPVLGEGVSGVQGHPLLFKQFEANLDWDPDWKKKKKWTWKVTS